MTSFLFHVIFAPNVFSGGATGGSGARAPERKPWGRTSTLFAVI